MEYSKKKESKKWIEALGKVESALDKVKLNELRASDYNIHNQTLMLQICI